MLLRILFHSWSDVHSPPKRVWSHAEIGLSWIVYAKNERLNTSGAIVWAQAWSWTCIDPTNSTELDFLVCYKWPSQVTLSCLHCKASCLLLSCHLLSSSLCLLLRHNDPVPVSLNQSHMRMSLSLTLICPLFLLLFKYWIIESLQDVSVWSSIRHVHTHMNCFLSLLPFFLSRLWFRFHAAGFILRPYAAL